MDTAPRTSPLTPSGCPGPLASTPQDRIASEPGICLLSAPRSHV